jgi:hypothetical protein
MHGLSTYLRRHHIGLLALFIALGGTSYAAVSLSANSVGARELKNQAVGSAELKDGSIKKRDLRAQLRASLRRGGSGATGPTGPVGPKGDIGTTGPMGPAGPGQGAAQSPAARVRRTTDTQIVPTATGPMGATVVQFPDPTAEQYDIGGMFDQAADNTVLTIPVAGTYIVTGAVRWAASTVETPGPQAGGMRNLFLHGPTSMTGQGGIRASSSVPASTTSGDTTRQNVATTERFNAGDEVFLSVSQTSGESVALDASQNQIHLSAAFVGP